MIKAVIFDMDGVIIDSEPLQMVAINQVLSQWKIALHEEDFIPMIGRRLSDDYHQIKEKFHIPVDYSEFVRMKNNRYQDLIQNSVQEMSGLSYLLTSLKIEGILRAVASGSSRDDIDLVLKELKLNKSFNVISSGDEVKMGKPHPEIYLLTASRLKTPAHNCIAIEDTTYGVKAAITAGMKCIALPHKYTSHQDFSEANAVVKSLEDITISFLKQLI